MKSAQHCPKCRTPITLVRVNLVVNDVIEALVPFLTEEQQIKRREVVHARQEEFNELSKVTSLIDLVTFDLLVRIALNFFRFRMGYLRLDEDESNMDIYETPEFFVTTVRRSPRRQGPRLTIVRRSELS